MSDRPLRITGKQPHVRVLVDWMLRNRPATFEIPEGTDLILLKQAMNTAGIRATVLFDVTESEE